MTRSALSLTDYTDAIDERWPEAELKRAILHDLPRRFHALSRTEQAEVLDQAPPRTGTRWDALLAATAEHIARLHDHPLPAWVNEPARFLDRPWVLSGIGVIRRDAIRYAPAAFIRHGALPDPKDLDARGGETHAWLP